MFFDFRSFRTFFLIFFLSFLINRDWRGARECSMRPAAKYNVHRGTYSCFVLKSNVIMRFIPSALLASAHLTRTPGSQSVVKMDALYCFSLEKRRHRQDGKRNGIMADGGRTINNSKTSRRSRVFFRPGVPFRPSRRRSYFSVRRRDDV